MKIATFNVNGINARLTPLLQWLARASPDVVCLQELKAPDSRFPAEALQAIGYESLWHGQSAWNGVAILAKAMTPIESRRGLPGDAQDKHSRYLEAAVGGVIIACVYLPNGNPQPGPKFDYKLAWFERLIQHARALFKSGHPVILAGDFNVVPTDFDIYNPKSWRKDALLQPASREAFQRLMKQGWTDALRTQFPNTQVFTFWDYFRNHWQRNAGLRIDHLLLSRELAPRLRDAGVDTWVRGEPHASDHAPTWAVLDLQKTPAQRKPKAKSTARAKSSTAASKIRRKNR